MADKTIKNKMSMLNKRCASDVCRYRQLHPYNVLNENKPVEHPLNESAIKRPVVPPSPIIEGYVNPLNSEMVTRVIATSTQKPGCSIGPSVSERRHPIGRINSNVSSDATSITASSSIMQKLDDILQNQHYIIQELNEVKTNMLSLDNKITEFRINSDAERLADNKLLRQNSVLTANINKQVKMLTGDEKDEVDLEIESMFPIKDLPGLSDVEERLKNHIFASKLITYLNRLHGNSTALETSFRSLALDNLLIDYNLDGRMGKKSLMNTNLFGKILFDVCGLSRECYMKELRQCVSLSHNRYSKSLAKQRKNNETARS